MSPPGLAILGAGIFAKEAHLPALASLGNSAVELKAVYSRSEKSAKELAQEAQEVLKLSVLPSVYHDGDQNADLDSLLARSDITAVIVVLPIATQPAIIRKALAADKHVLSEKPVAPDVASGLELIAEYNSKYKPKGLVWRVAENYEVEPGYQAAGKVVRAGKIGKVTCYNARVVNHVSKDSKWYKTPWRTVPDYQGGFLHTIAALRVMLPSPLVSLSGYASLNQEHLPPHDTINVAVKSEDGSHGLVELTWGAPTPSRSSLAGNSISITGSDGWISITQGKAKDVNGDEYNAFRIVVRTVKKDEKGGVIGETEEVIEERVQGVELELKSFLAAIAASDDGFGDPFDALKDVAFIQAGLESNGNPVDLVKLVQQ
ncbi:unnamed protein product [Somion occarium]|uniref:Uncharacterized protein n=1 Tax=Somion occarium TaxID=3059160 RepID=A0ABP1DSX3_9APHY